MTPSAALSQHDVEYWSPPSGEETVMPDVERAKRWAEILLEARSLSTLSDDWDGLGAEAPNFRIVQTVIKVLEQLSSRDCVPPSSVTATPLGSVIIEWYRVLGADDAYFEMEVATPVRVEWMERFAGREAKHGTIPLQ